MKRFALLAIALAIPAVAAFSAPAPADAAVVVTMQVPTVYVSLGAPATEYPAPDDRYERQERCERERREREERFERERMEQQERYERERAEMYAWRHDDDERDGWNPGRGHGWGRDRGDRR